MVLINEIKRAHALKGKRRVGRGGKRGTYSGRGQKGQKARSGRKIKSAAREALLKIPQKRGTGSKEGTWIKKNKLLAINLRDFEAGYKEGETVSPKTLLQRRIVQRVANRIPAIKILGNGKLNKKLIFLDVVVSQSVKTQVEKLGGSIK